MASTAKITETLRMHYERSFRAHGATAKGVDWGECTADLVCRYDKMAAVMPAGAAGPVSLLDVGWAKKLFHAHQRGADHGTRLWGLLALGVWYAVVVERRWSSTDPLPIADAHAFAVTP